MSHFDPIEIDGLKFDKGMILYEFDALREPEKSRFPRIGEWVKSRTQMNQIPTPQMFWKGEYWPDLYIANQLDAVPEGWYGNQPYFSPEHFPSKADWPADVNLQSASIACHGENFHETFIEPMCRKITGRGTREIAAKYHRAVWLPLYWPQTLREGKSLPTPFWYPKVGYASAGGLVARNQDSRSGAEKSGRDAKDQPAIERTQITLTFLLAKPRRAFSVVFVVDDSAIYRITDMDVCAGIETDWHRWVVESRPCGPDVFAMDLLRFCEQSKAVGSMKINLPLPTIENVKAGWKPAKNMNERLWDCLNG